MFVVRETFTARPGQASKLAAMLKDAVATRPSMKTRVLTDFIAGFNTVVLETETPNLNAFEAEMKEYATSPESARRCAATPTCGSRAAARSTASPEGYPGHSASCRLPWPGLTMPGHGYIATDALEWAGGHDALERLTTRFYQHAAADPILGPLFRDMDATTRSRRPSSPKSSAAHAVFDGMAAIRT